MASTVPLPRSLDRPRVFTLALAPNGGDAFLNLGKSISHLCQQFADFGASVDALVGVATEELVNLVRQANARLALRCKRPRYQAAASFSTRRKIAWRVSELLICM